MSIEVIKPGLLSSLQDLGRYGYQRFGVVVGGVMDEYAHRRASALVGNLEDEATLEMTLMGPSLLFHRAAVIAICGADLSPSIGSRPVPLERPVWVCAGARLDFGKRNAGMRAYLAVRGGFAVPDVMDSRSTYARGGFGGLEGRVLRKGDRLPLGADAVGNGQDDGALQSLGDFLLLEAPKLPLPWLPDGALDRVRVIAGQHWNLFADEAQRAFVESEFKVTPQSDRMGYRLEGPALSKREASEMISEGVAFGTIQVPPDGQPIVLMADRQTTGGYPKIATVASVDLAILAQIMPGQTVRFQLISLDLAQRLYLAREDALAALRTALKDIESAP